MISLESQYSSAISRAIVALSKNGTDDDNALFWATRALDLALYHHGLPVTSIEAKQAQDLRMTVFRCRRLGVSNVINRGGPWKR